MAEYSVKVKAPKLICTRPDLLGKWIGKHDGLWCKMTIEQIVKNRNRKSTEQLGYYWGLLVPEITAQLTADGHTNTIEGFGVHAERPFDEDDTHELLTLLCNHVGDNGALMRLSNPDMTVQRMGRVIANVINFAVGSLHMNGEKLEAWRQ